MRFCARCGCKVDVESEIAEYPYYCPNCDENMYGFETYESTDLEDILYGCYLHEWWMVNIGGKYGDCDPVCQGEFMDNEFWEEEWMEYLLTLYGMHHKIADYRKGLRD